MINKLVQSALKTGCLSVESEALMRQVLAMKAYQASDIEALSRLSDAVNAGSIQREANGKFKIPLP